MSILRRANEQAQSDWVPVPEDIWRWVIGEPEIVLSDRFGTYRVRFPLSLLEEERARCSVEHPLPAPPPGQPIYKQSWRVSYMVGLSLGWVGARDGQYHSTRLIDFLSVCFGKTNVKAFRQWIENGGGPPRPADPDDQQAELDSIQLWLKWWEDMQVIGAISHHTAESGRVFANFGGPLAVGSLPNQRDDGYQALGRGKLRSMIAESEAASAMQAKPTAEAVVERVERLAKRYNEILGDGSEDAPF